MNCGDSRVAASPPSCLYRCWPKLFRPSGCSSAFLLMKRPTKDCFLFPRRSIIGTPLPSWLLTPGTVLMRRHVRNKGDTFRDPVELVEGNPTYSVVRLRDGRESTVSTSDLAPYPPAHNGNADPANSDTLLESDGVCGNDVEDVAADETDGVRFEKETDESSVPEDIASDSEPALPHRSTRRRKPPDRCGFNVASI